MVHAAYVVRTLRMDTRLCRVRRTASETSSQAQGRHRVGKRHLHHRYIGTLCKWMTDFQLEDISKRPSPSEQVPIERAKIALRQTAV